MTVAPTLRERKKSRTRAALFKAALRLFSERGFEATTADEIAAAAGVSRRTFFRYFPTKEAVMFLDREERLVRFRELLAGRRDEEAPLDAVRRASLELAAEYMRDWEEVVEQQRVIDSSPALLAYDRDFDRRWEAVIAESFLGRQNRDEAAGRQARVMAAAIMGVMRATLREWFHGEVRGDLVRLGTESLDLLERGLNRASKGKG